MVVPRSENLNAGCRSNTALSLVLETRPVYPGHAMYDVEAIVREPLLLEPLRRSVFDGAQPGYLRSLKLKVTARCNLKCVMCRYGRGWCPPELDTGEWTRVLEQAGELGCRKVHFSGGEVLVRSDFEELVAAAAAARIKVTFTSNLTLLTKARAKRLLSHKLSGISTSLDGATAKTHDRVRGIDGSFKRTLRALAWIRRYRRDHRPRIRVNFVMMRDNFHEYPALVRLAGELGAVDVVPMPVDTKRKELRPSKRMIRYYNEILAPEVAELRKHFSMPAHGRAIHPFGQTANEVRASGSGHYASDYYNQHLCYAPYLHAFAAWDGKVYLCCMTNGRIDPLGDLKHQTLREVFLGERFQQIRRQMANERLDACHACDMVVTENNHLRQTLGSSPPGAIAKHGPRRLPLLP